MTILRIAFINIARKPARSAALAALVALAAFFLFSGATLNANLAGSLSDLSGRLGADTLIVPKGYENTTQSILLRGEPGAFYMSASLLPLIAANIHGIARITPQFFLSSFDADCCDAKVQVIGFDPATDFIITPWAVQKDALSSLTNGDIVIGALINAEPGQTLLFYSRRYLVKAKLHPTGLGLDTSILMPLPGVYDIIHRTPNLLPAIAADLGKLADVKYEGRKALICLVGDDIRGRSGMASQVFTAIRHINIRMISQGASEINMSFMIDEDDADEAVRSLHAAFFQDPDPAIFDVAARRI